MILNRRALLASACLAPLAACAAQIEAKAPAAVAPPMAAPDPSAQLRQLFIDSDEAGLKLSPLEALFRGDMRYADQFGDYITDEFLSASKSNSEADLRRLVGIDRNALGAQDKIAYDVFKYQTEFDLKSYALGIEQISVRLPIDHFNGLHTFFPDLQSGQSAAPYKTVQDYENGLSRATGFVAYMDRAIGRMREGIAMGYTQPLVVTQNVIGQLKTMLDLGVDKSPYMLPVQNFPADMADADKARLAAAYRASMETQLLPVYARLKTFMESDYLAASRSGDKPGLISLRDGEKVYSYLIESHTTTSMTADEIHALGLSEVARITQGMEAIRKQVGFKGNLKQFFAYQRTDPRFKFKTKEALIQGYNDIWTRLKPQVARLFSVQPKAPFEVRPVPEFMEANQAGAYYQSGTPDGSRPGVFYANTYDLPSRTSPGMETLFLHEAVPGHHFQISLAQENESLPPFMRFGGNTAYVEGWALYAESLGEELGLYTDPYQKFGNYDDEMLRAMRLVVDTGLHAKGWSRQQAIQYFMDNSAQSATDAKNEIDRYIAMPGQALAYKVGQIRIRATRTRAEKALGARFDIRAYHDQVLNTGALPLGVLDSKIDAWIASQSV
jgi:uncharacterized protein (DUF885 family)